MMVLETVSTMVRQTLKQSPPDAGMSRQQIVKTQERHPQTFKADLAISTGLSHTIFEPSFDPFTSGVERLWHGHTAWLSGATGLEQSRTVSKTQFCFVAEGTRLKQARG